MVSKDIEKSVKRYLQTLARGGLPVRFGVVFGSQARGDPKQWSDIDLLVVSPKYDAERSWDDISYLWITAGRTDSRIEPIPCGERQYVEDDSSAIIEIARREGQIIPLAE